MTTMIGQSFGAAAETKDLRQLERLAELFRLLSDKTRLNILILLADGERNVGGLCQALRLPQPTVSHHIGLLRMGGLLAGRRDGKQIYYGLGRRADSSTPDALAFDLDGITVRLGESAGARVTGA